MKLSPFPIPTIPFRDESLAGLIARACARNGYDRLSLLLQHVAKPHKITRTTPLWTIPAYHIDFRNLAQHLGCGEHELRNRHHNARWFKGSSSIFDNFLGSPIRPKMHITTVRRFSPTALSISPHHRSAWILKPLVYCHETGEELLERCPECGKEQEWRRTNGIEFCDYCINDDFDPISDLRNCHAPRRLSGDQLVLYRNIATLIVPSEIPSAIAPGELSAWDRWEIFELIITLAVMIQRGTGNKYNWIDRTRSDHVKSQWHECLMMAGAAVASWPSGMLDVIDQVMMYADTRLAHGERTRWIGPLRSPEYYTRIEKIGFAIKDVVNRFYPPARPGTPRRREPVQK